MKTKRANRLHFFKEPLSPEKYISVSTDEEGVVTLHTWIVLRPSPDEQIFEEVDKQIFGLSENNIANKVKR